MTTATVTLPSGELKGRIGKLERELQGVQSKLPNALRNAAVAYLGGRSNDDVSSIRTQIRRLEDVLAGLRQLAALAELDELRLEIDRREDAYSKSTRLAAELRGQANNSALATAERNSAFGKYQATQDAHDAERLAIDRLTQRCAELETT